jgi:phage tail-like protein
MPRQDPYRGFRFLVEFESVQKGGFSRVKGLAREVKVDTYHEGGLNEFEHKHIAQATFPNLVLEHGIADTWLWDWQQDVTEGRVQRKKLSVILRDDTGAEVWRWHAQDAFPVKWSIADLDAASNTVLVESVEFVHRGILRG